MKCPNCGTENEANARYCASCGVNLPNEKEARAADGAMKAVTTGGFVFGKKAREARIKEIVDSSAVISVQAYNAVIGAVLLWGLLINYLLCSKVTTIATLFPNMNPIVFGLIYIVVVMIGVGITVKAQSPLISFLGYNIVVIPFGLVISTLVQHYGGVSSEVVTQAFLYTLLIGAAILATVIFFPKAFEKLGRALGVALLGLILCEIILLIIGARQQWISWIAAALFSLYLGYDFYRSQQYPKTVKNAVASAMDIYMDLANLFIRLLSILGNRRD